MPGQSYTKLFAIKKKDDRIVEVLACDACGALVVEQTRKAHDNWHVGNDSPLSEYERFLGRRK